MPDTPQSQYYDTVPYPSMPYVFTQPDRLAAVGTIFGLNPTKVDHCRVLEIGCAAGGNIIPLAERYPHSQFLGLDLSTRQIADGQNVIRQLGLNNIRIEQRDILDVGADFGEFDFIIAHGVYSWVPPQVAEKILEICSSYLNPNGLALISYNTFPGGHFRNVIRDMFRYRCRELADPAEKIRQSRAALEFFAKFTPAHGNGYRAWLQTSEARLRELDPSFLLHEQLEPHNYPCYFHEFVERAARHGLNYVADSEHISSQLANYPAKIAEPLRAMSAGYVDYEQYADFLNNTPFRYSILCRAGAKLETAPNPDRALDLHLSCCAKPKTPPDLRSAAPVVFTGQYGDITVLNPLLKAMLLLLSEIWPRSLIAKDLIAQARARVPAEPMTDDARVMQTMLPTFRSRNVEFQTHPPTFTPVVSARPVVSPYARFQAQTESAVTNRRHCVIRIDELTRQAMFRLDGSRDLDRLRNDLSEAIANGSVKIPELTQHATDAAQLRDRLLQPLEAALQALAYHCLLIA